MDECKPLSIGVFGGLFACDQLDIDDMKPKWQGLSLVHFPAQRKHFVWNRGCV